MYRRLTDHDPDPRSRLRSARYAEPGLWQPHATPTAADLMTEDPRAVTPDATLAEAARAMRELDVGMLPVVSDAESRRLLGVVTDRDLVVRALAGGAAPDAPVGDHMTRGVAACHPADRARDVLHVMEAEQVRRVPIVDYAGTLVGIVAQADVALELGARGEHRARRVEQALRRISAPGHPRRGR